MTYRHLLRAALVSVAALSLLAPGNGAMAQEQEAETLPVPTVEELWEVWAENHPAGTDDPDSAPISWSPTTGIVEADPEFEDQLAADLSGSDLPRRVSFSLEGITTTYTIQDDLEISIFAPSAAPDPGENPDIGGGKDRRGVYVVLTPFEQDLILNGSGFMLGAAICAIPAVGWGLCTAVGAVIVVYGAWAGNRKRCTGSYPKAKIYPFASQWNTCVR